MDPEAERVEVELTEIIVKEGCEMVILDAMDRLCSCGREKQTWNDQCYICTAIKVAH